MRHRLLPAIVLAALLLLAAPATPGGVAFAQRGAPPTLGDQELGVHVVQAGESLFRLAARYDMPAADLARLNGIHTGAVLVPGWPLWVPLEQAVNAMADQPALPADLAVLPASPSGDAIGHRVQAGETLYAISRRYGVDVESLKLWNGLPPDGSIRAGAELVISGPDRDLPGSSGSGSGTDGPGAAVPAQAGGGETRVAHVVSAGETLTSIAARYGESVVSLRRFNDLLGDDIQVGQRILVPARGAGPEAAAGGAKRIEVDVSEQRMYVWQGQTLVWSFVVSTGLPGYPTRRGSFAVQSKIPNAWSSAWQLWMPHWLGIYWAGASENGIHALPIINGQRLWGGYLGSPISYGCVVLETADAERLYNWAEIGTPVIVRD